MERRQSASHKGESHIVMGGFKKKKANCERNIYGREGNRG